MAQVPATSYKSTSLGDVAAFTIPFPFLSRAEVFVTVDGAQSAFTWINDGLIQLPKIPKRGAIVRRYRSTAAYVPLHQFSQGVPFLPRYVDRDFTQTLYAVQESVNDTAGTAALALGTAELALGTAQGALALVGERTQYMVLGPYGPGLHFQTTSQVFSYLGEFYAPGPGITLPYTTTGVGAAEIANFRSVGDAVLRQDLSNDADPAKGAAYIGRNAQVVDSIAELRALLKTSPSKHAFATGYYGQDDDGGGPYWLDSGDTTSIDNGGTIIVAADGGRWKLIFSNSVAVGQFGAKGDGVTDDTAAINAARTYAKAAGVEVRFAAKTYKTSAVIDVSGTVLRGQAGGYRNANGTIIQGSGGHNIFEQITANADDTHIGLHNFRLKGGTIGAKVRYMLHSHWSNVHITGCTDGVQFGNSSDAGGLFCTFDNIEVDVTGTALDVNGNGFVNANSFNQCFFKGGNYGGRVRCTGGIGATNNVFNCTEFLGDRYGIELENTSNTVFNQPYLESHGPAIHCVGSRNIGVTLNEGVYGEIKNNNTTGKSAFIYHSGTGALSITVNGGWVYLAADPLTAGISFIASDSPGTCSLFMLDKPELDVAASGFNLLGNMQSSRTQVVEGLMAYAAVWSAPTPPNLGNGSFSSTYARNGNICTVTIQLAWGSTTTPGAGSWTFTAPYPAAAAASGIARTLDAGTGYNIGMAAIEAGSSIISIYRPGTAELFASASPQVWANGDALNITISYPC